VAHEGLPAGYGKDQLYMLKDYRDATTADLVPAMGQEATMRAAFRNMGSMPDIRTRAGWSRILMARWR
jgi:hypothetical protein